MFFIPSQSLYLLHESLCSMPNPLELLKSQLTACIEQLSACWQLKLFFCAALQLFLGGTHHFFGLSSLQFIVLANSSQWTRTTPHFGAFDGKFYNVILELSVSFNFSMHKYTFTIVWMLEVAKTFSKLNQQSSCKYIHTDPEWSRAPIESSQYA